MTYPLCGTLFTTHNKLFLPSTLSSLLSSLLSPLMNKVLNRGDINTGYQISIESTRLYWPHSKQSLPRHRYLCPLSSLPYLPYLLFPFPSILSAILSLLTPTSIKLQERGFFHLNAATCLIRSLSLLNSELLSLQIDVKREKEITLEQRLQPFLPAGAVVGEQIYLAGPPVFIETRFRFFLSISSCSLSPLLSSLFCPHYPSPSPSPNHSHS